MHMTSQLATLKRGRGRPRKFQDPSTAMTLTLPRTVIAALRRIDPDVSRAVVKLAHTKSPKPAGRPAAVLARYGRNAVILVDPSRMLEQQTGISLVPLADGRALISFDESMTISQLELALRDAIEEATLSAEDARIFKSVSALLKDARLSHNVKLHQRQIIVLEVLKQRKKANRQLSERSA